MTGCDSIRLLRRKSGQRGSGHTMGERRGRGAHRPMALDITQREREGVTIVVLKGRLTAGPECTAFRDTLAALNQKGVQNLVLNLGGVDYIDSTGLGALVMCATSLRKNNGNVKLLNLNRRNIELLVMTKLATVFEIFTDEQDSVNSFYPDRKIKAFDILSFVQDLKRDG